MKSLSFFSILTIFFFTSCNYINWDEISQEKKKEQKEKEQEKEGEDEDDDTEISNDNNKKVEIELFGFDIDGKGKMDIYDIVPATKVIEKRNSIKTQEVYALGELVFDRSNSFVVSSDATQTNIYNINTGKANTIQQLFALERDDLNGKYYGVRTNSNRATIYEYDITQDETTDLLTIKGIKGIRAGSSGYAIKGNLYFFNSTNGLEIIDVINKRVIRTLSGIVEAEYDPINDRLVGIDPKSSGTFVEYNLDTEELSTLGNIKGFEAYSQGATAFDYENQLYIMKSLDGIIFYDLNKMDIYWEINNKGIDFVELAYHSEIENL